MKINQEKLNKYLSEEKIIEFNSDEECLEYFNTYDYQNFKTVTEMKKFQGEYGFNIGRRRYHAVKKIISECFHGKVQKTEDG